MVVIRNGGITFFGWLGMEAYEVTKYRALGGTIFRTYWWFFRLRDRYACSDNVLDLAGVIISLFSNHVTRGLYMDYLVGEYWVLVA